ncbi:MAG: T9SS type A sorting domain-containing protein [Marinilabiliaceae bacterium]|nr:T9SS type A sorting domain-containing protein [Marinilabiliaceae bacterium]
MNKNLLLIALFCSIAISNTWAQNILLNPSFEEPITDANWKWRVDVTNNPTLDATTTVVTDAKDGQKALHVNIAELPVKDSGIAKDRWDVKLQQTRSFEEGKTYELGFWTKGTAQSTAIEFEILFGKRSDNTKVFLDGYERFDITADWTYINYSFTVPVEPDYDPVASEISLLFIKNGSFYLDDVSIKEVNIADGSFESSSWILDVTDKEGVGTIEYMNQTPSNPVKDGLKAMKATITTPSASVYGIKATQPLTENIKGQNIRVSFWGRTDDASGTQQKLYLPWYYTSTTQAPTFDLTQNWEKYSVVVPYTDNGKGKGNELVFYFWQAATYYVDDVKVELVTNGVNNSAPVVDAGANITCAPGDVITLNAQVSDPDGDLVELWWSLPDTEEVLNVTAAERKTNSLTFTAPSTIKATTDLVFTIAGDDFLLQGEKSVTVTVKPVSTAIGDIEIEKSKLVFPNPATSKINFANEVIAVAIYNINGSLLKEETMTSHTMDIAEYPAGIYLLKLTLNNGTVITNKLLKR